MFITEELFEQIQNGEVFRIVTTKYQTVYNPLNAELTFVCKKGGVEDWAIYAGLSTMPVPYIKQFGDKVTGKEMIQSICPCEESVFERYRF